MNSLQMVHTYSYTSFLKELNHLLKTSGIVPARLPVMAEYSPKNRHLSSSGSETNQKVGRVILYIEEHLADELNLDLLAGEVDLSKYQLIRHFREDEGTTPWKYLIRKRVERVKKLLEEGMSPGQAAVEAGFYDQSHLNKIFRKETGLTPKEYQEKNFRNRN